LLNIYQYFLDASAECDKNTTRAARAAGIRDLRGIAASYLARVVRLGGDKLQRQRTMRAANQQFTQALPALYGKLAPLDRRNALTSTVIRKIQGPKRNRGRNQYREPKPTSRPGQQR
jgi:hypothetical protein